MSRNPSTGRILKNDYGSLLMLIIVGVMCALAIGGAYFGLLPKRRGGGIIEVDSNLAIILLVIAAVFTVLFVWLASRRIANIKRIISSGPEANGRILWIGFDRDRGRVEYEYQYNGQTYQSGNAIFKNKETKRIQSGEAIAVIIDPDNPARAYIASLYV